MRRIIARENDKNSVLTEGYFHYWTRDRHGNPCALIERDDGVMFISFGVKQMRFIDKVEKEVKKGKKKATTTKLPDFAVVQSKPI